MVNVSRREWPQGSLRATLPSRPPTREISDRDRGQLDWQHSMERPDQHHPGRHLLRNWKSTNPNTPAVTISTTAPVIIQNSYVTGPADLINDPDYGNNLTVKNVIGIGVNPNVSGQGYGVFVDAQNSVLLDVENCYFENVRFGVYLRGYTGNRNGTQTITILNNRGRNILGVESNGNNGSLPGETNWQWAHAIQLVARMVYPASRLRGMKL